MAIHLKKCSWSNCGKKEILCLALSNCFSFFIFLAFLEHIPILVQVTIILFNSFPKLSELWYGLKSEAEFMQFRICDHFNGNSQARIVRKQYFLLLILYIQYSCSFPPCTKTSWPEIVFQTWKTSGKLQFEFYSRSDYLKEFSGVASIILLSCAYKCCGKGYRISWKIGLKRTELLINDKTNLHWV